MNRPEIRNSRILVTGGAGFIGSHLVDELQLRGAKEVIIVDNMFLGNENNIADAMCRGAIFYKDDAEFKTSMDYIFSKHEIDTVFNCATKALNYSFLNPANAFSTNVAVIENLLELQRAKRFKTLCHFSTSEVYGTALYEPMDEKHPIHPTTTYAAGKAAADLMLESYVRMFNLDAIIVRPFNNYGPRQNYKGFLAGVIPITLSRIFSGLKPEIHGTGQQSRDFILVKDTVKAILEVFPLLEAGESVNISADSQIKIEDVILHLAKLSGYEGEIIRKTARDSDVMCHIGSNEKLRKLINYNPTSFDEGITATVSWYKNIFVRQS
ncbi:MAG: NAD-dependent epimerase/dehydratase family protein [Leptospiraceae bacterium]|nr:NAD-dependent epimerase/dehydratase family protein [Leptospiraceae bacterium]